MVIGPADLPIAEGEALIVYAVGSLDDDTLGVLTESISGLHTTPNQVNTGNSPVSNGFNVAALVAVLGAAAVVLGGGQALARRNG